MTKIITQVTPTEHAMMTIAAAMREKVVLREFLEVVLPLESKVRFNSFRLVQIISEIRRDNLTWRRKDSRHADTLTLEAAPKLAAAAADWRNALAKLGGLSQEEVETIPFMAMVGEIQDGITAIASGHGPDTLIGALKKVPAGEQMAATADEIINRQLMDNISPRKVKEYKLILEACKARRKWHERASWILYRLTETRRDKDQSDLLVEYQRISKEGKEYETLGEALRIRKRNFEDSVAGRMWLMQQD